MGTSGVPLNITENEIRDAIIKYKGVIRKMSEAFDISPETMYRHYYKYPNLKPLLEEYRNCRKDRMLDTAEDVLDYAMSECKEADINAALKASMYFLNNRGKERGYSSLPEQSKEGQKDALNAVLTLANAMTRASSRNPSEDKEHTEDQHS